MNQKQFNKKYANKIICGDCLDVMKDWPDGCVDLVLTDPPYGTTACKWDSIIPLEPMWEQLKRLVKLDRAVVLTASQPFTTTLISSNKKDFAFSWVWDKCFAGNYVQAKRQPLKVHEDVVVFCFTGKQPIYFPQMMKREIPIEKGSNKQGKAIPIAITVASKVYGKTKRIYMTKHPISIIKFNIRKERGFHPTQKPTALMKYLIKTYTNEDELVLDFTCGSGTTCVAAKMLGRNYIGVDISEEYCDIARQRLKYTNFKPSLFDKPVKKKKKKKTFFDEGV